jgi:hypothetical protein
VLDDPGGSTSNFAVIDQWQLNGGTNQQWDLVPVGNGNNYFIQNVASHLVLDDSFSTSEGTVIDQFQLKDGSNLDQQWQLQYVAGNAYVITNAYSNQVLDNSLSTNNGTPIDQWPGYGGPNQQWDLVAALDGSHNESFYITNAFNGNPLLGEYTEWTFVWLADYYALIVNDSNGDVLYASNTINGSPILEGQLSGALNQQWSIDDAGLVQGVEAGSVISNAYDGLYLDAPDGSDTLIQDQAAYISLTAAWNLDTSWPYPAY